MTTLDEARSQADWMETINHPDAARVIRDLIHQVEASRTVTDADVNAALAAAKGFRPGWMRAALEAAAAARSQASGTHAKAAPKDGLNQEESEP